MTLSKEIFENLRIAGPQSSIPALTDEERRFFYEALDEFGLKKKRAYLRIFRTGYGSGFEEWELRGIRKIITEYCHKEGIPVPSNEDMSRFYVETLEGRRQDFWEYVSPLGIGKNCAIYRFKNWNFQEWELMGIRAIIDKLTA